MSAPNFLSASATLEGKGYSGDLFKTIKRCTSYQELVEEVVKKPFLMNELAIYMRPGIVPLQTELVKALYKLTPEQLKDPMIKNVATALRNRGMLNRNAEPADYKISGAGEKKEGVQKAIMVLEVPYVVASEEFQGPQKELVMKEVPSEVVEKTVEYIYSSDSKRKELIYKLDRELLYDMAKLADMWQIWDLKAQCDEELCNSFSQLDVEDIQGLVGQAAIANIHPKFSKFLDFIASQAKGGSIESIIKQIQTLEGARQLASQCNSEEIKTLIMRQAFQVPPGTYGIAEWEKAFPVTIAEVPPLPDNIDAILEQQDPWEPDKKLSETCKLFLRPEKVILREEGGKELLLSAVGVEEIAKKGVKPVKMSPANSEELKVWRKLPARKSGWVLIRKNVASAGEGIRYYLEELKEKDKKKDFETPSLIDAVLLNTLIFACDGEPNKDFYTYCSEKIGSDNLGLNLDKGGVIEISMDNPQQNLPGIPVLDWGLAPSYNFKVKYGA